MDYKYGRNWLLQNPGPTTNISVVRQVTEVTVEQQARALRPRASCVSAVDHTPWRQESCSVNTPISDKSCSVNTHDPAIHTTRPESLVVWTAQVPRWLGKACSVSPALVMWIRCGEIGRPAVSEMLLGMPFPAVCYQANDGWSCFRFWPHLTSGEQRGQTNVLSPPP